MEPHEARRITWTDLQALDMGQAVALLRGAVRLDVGRPAHGREHTRLPMFYKDGVVVAGGNPMGRTCAPRGCRRSGRSMPRHPTSRRRSPRPEELGGTVVMPLMDRHGERQDGRHRRPHRRQHLPVGEEGLRRRRRVHGARDVGWAGPRDARRPEPPWTSTRRCSAGTSRNYRTWATGR